MENSIWGTSKKSTENKSVWSSMKSEPVQPEQQDGTNVMEIEHVYKALPIFTTILEDHVEFNKYMKEVILEHRQQHPEDIKSNVKAWHSSWLTHKENPKFNPLVQRVLNACEFLSTGYFQTQKLEFEVTNLWAMMYEDTEWTKRHSHYPSHFACCYYVDVEPGCAPLLFEVPQYDGVNDKCETFTLQPQNGMLAIWPAILHHEVPPTKGKRMCISLNIDKKVLIKNVG